MKGIVKVTAALLATALLTGNMCDQVWAGCGHHSRSVCTTEYAACWGDGVCLEDGDCDVDGVCIYGGNCLGGGESRGNTHHRGRSHRQGHHH